ncbi:ABC transporter [Paracoccus contaminans]|uniref:ABC transporter n=2 Tax=Paracoccus contaminans TaxID=1945662 RepID=A0A1W6CXR7_9RHOB|nr:ABC transporter [Paracoccus contaminans]
MLACLLLGGCAAGPQGGPIADPYEPMNRRVHAFNTALDARVLRPLGQAVRPAARPAGGGTAPPAARAPGQPDTSALDMISNFGANLSLPGKVVNHLLQGRPRPAASNTARFALNTALGLGGLFDPAGRDFALPETDTDFGETLHVWGVPAGAYLELPVLGPSSERDAAGKIVDLLLIDPLQGVLTPEQKLAGTAARILSKAGERARFGSTVDSVLHESADSYAQTRLLYSQHRRYELKQQEDIIDPYAD